jgi:hypothetical protein
VCIYQCPRIQHIFISLGQKMFHRHNLYTLLHQTFGYIYYSIYQGKDDMTVILNHNNYNQFQNSIFDLRCQSMTLKDNFPYINLDCHNIDSHHILDNLHLKTFSMSLEDIDTVYHYISNSVHILLLP